MTMTLVYEISLKIVQVTSRHSGALYIHVSAGAFVTREGSSCLL